MTDELLFDLWYFRNLVADGCCFLAGELLLGLRYFRN